MGTTFELKTISAGAIDAAVAKAEQYRLLNQPEQAESICLDILAVDDGHQEARRILVLAMTDQFAESATSSRVKQARRHAQSLGDPYDRDYFRGLVHEREGRAYLSKGLRSSFAYECFREALDCFEAAAQQRPAGNDDAILRWNSCVRTIQGRGLEPPAPEAELPLE